MRFVEWEKLGVRSVSFGTGWQLIGAKGDTDTIVNILDILETRYTTLQESHLALHKALVDLLYLNNDKSRAKAEAALELAAGEIK